MVDGNLVSYVSTKFKAPATDDQRSIFYNGEPKKIFYDGQPKKIFYDGQPQQIYYNGQPKKTYYEGKPRQKWNETQPLQLHRIKCFCVGYVGEQRVQGKLNYINMNILHNVVSK